MTWFVSLMVGCMLAGGNVPSATQGEDWPTWLGPRGDSTWLGPEMEKLDPAIPHRWKKPITGGYSGIIVVGGRVFTMDRPTPEQERILCLDARTGDKLWELRYDTDYSRMPDQSYANGPRAAPTWSDGKLFTLGTVGHVHCLNAETGQVIWSRDLVQEEGAVVPEWGLAAAPVCIDDLVLIVAGAQPGGNLLALNADTGREAWRAGDDPAGYSPPTVASTRSGTQLFLWTPLHFHAIDPKDGKVLWSIPYKVTYGVSIAQPLVRNDIALVAGYWEGSKAVRLGPSPTDATLLWEDSRHLRGLMSAPLYREGVVYLLDKHFGLTAFDLQTAHVRWKDDKHRITPGGRNPQASFVWLGDSDRSLALNSDGELVLLRLTPERFEVMGRIPVLGPTWAYPAYAGDAIFARNDQEIVCLPLK